MALLEVVAVSRWEVSKFYYKRFLYESSHVLETPVSRSVACL